MSTDTQPEPEPQYPTRPATRGGFNNPAAHSQCTARSKRSGVQCKGPAVIGSDKCRMHGGNNQKLQGGARNSQFTSGRKSNVLREGTRLHTLYEQALSEPDLTEMSDHLALLEAHMNEILEAAGDDPVPTWREFISAVDQLESAWGVQDAKRIGEAVTELASIVRGGARWDSSWDKVINTIDHIRKLADTEVKRKKDLGQMIPVEKVVTLMAAVAHAVKANVTDPAQIQAVYHELARLHGVPRSAGDLPLGRVIDVEQDELEEVVDEDQEELDRELVEARNTLSAATGLEGAPIGDFDHES